MIAKDYISEKTDSAANHLDAIRRVMPNYPNELTAEQAKAVYERLDWARDMIDCAMRSIRDGLRGGEVHDE